MLSLVSGASLLTVPTESVQRPIHQCRVCIYLPRHTFLSTVKRDVGDVAHSRLSVIFLVRTYLSLFYHIPELLTRFLLARATDITGQVQWNDVCRSPSLASSLVACSETLTENIDLTALGYATASLDEGSLYGSITADGNFTM